MPNKTYLEITVNERLLRRFDVTSYPEDRIYKYIEEVLPNSVSIEFRQTKRELITGKTYEL
jgi:hypothetical protein